MCDSYILLETTCYEFRIRACCVFAVVAYFQNDSQVPTTVSALQGSLQPRAELSCIVKLL